MGIDGRKPVPARPTLEEIRAASRRLAGVIVRTPLIPLEPPSSVEILLKPEMLQPTGSFKLRGVFHAVASLPEPLRSRGLSTVSAGNTARALAWSARHFGVPARSLMPATAPRVKVDAVRREGARPILVSTAELFRFLRDHAWESEPLSFIHPWTDRDVMIGHGTIGLEIHHDLPEVRTVFVPVGGGGLIGGVGSALEALDPSIRVVAVEPEGCPALHESLRRGAPAEVACRTICDGVAVPYITDEMFPLLEEIVDEAVLVSETSVRRAIHRLALGNGLVAEGSAALAVAAALEHPGRVDGPAVCLVTGGNIDSLLLRSILREFGESGSADLRGGDV